MREDALNGDKALSLGDLHSNAGVATIGLGVERRELFGRKQHAIRIIQLVDQPPGCFFIQGSRIDGVDEAAGNDIENLVQKTSALLALALLKYEAAGHQRDEDEAAKHEFS